ncbi:MAG: glycoside hydrolase family 2 TIM barrel-domain containing protein [Armatimonadota bacterium]
MILVLAFLATQVVAPKTIALNDGWQFASLTNPPSVWTGADAVSTSQWNVVKVSSQETEGENAPATNAYDGNPNTIWHSQWQTKQAPYPHELIIDLGVKTEAIGFRLLPRQSGAQNGKPNHIEVYLSQSRTSWGDPVVAADVPDTSNLFQCRFSPKVAQFLRLVVSNGHRDKEPFVALAEVGLIRNLDAKQKKDWESQYHIAKVESGDARFDLNREILEKVKTQELAKIKPSDWHSATLPHAAWIRPLNKSDVWQGVTYYRRALDIDPVDLKRSLELTIGAAMQVSDLWLNGEHIASRKGGYLPLIARLTDKVKAHNELLVRLDNSDNPLVPPGKPQQDLDFMYGAGIHRESKLDIQNPVHIVRSISARQNESTPTVTTLAATSNGAMLKLTTCIRNDSNDAKEIKLVHEVNTNIPKVKKVIIPSNSSSTVVEMLDISDPILWSPTNPHLYQMMTRIMDEKNKIIDSFAQKFGICTIEVSRAKGFILNGRPLELVGTNRHQDYPWVGPALSRQANYRDAKLIKESGHNIVRLAHYPQSEEFLNACDEFGILTIPCIAGWQFLNKDPRFEQQVEEDIKELVLRDSTHPCVAWLETSLNETYPDNKIAQSWANAARSTILGKNILLAGDAKPGAPWDIAYNQWKDEDYSRPQTAMPDKPGYIREYGDYEFGGAGSSSRVRIGQGIDKLLGETWNHVWSVNHLRPQLPWTMGYGTWEMFDHNVPYGEGVSASGLCDLFRRKKPSFWFYKSQQFLRPFATSARVYVKLIADWQSGPPTRRVVVFTNCNEAVLSVNGKEIARKSVAKGESTKYEKAKPFDGSNTINLVNAPIVFENVPFSPGKLSVSVSQMGTKTFDSVYTAGPADHIKLWIDDQGIPAGRNDLVFVRAAVVDANETICPYDNRKISFTVAGAAIAGEGTVKCEMGVASALIRTPLKASTITCKAIAKNLKPGRLELKIK